MNLILAVLLAFSFFPQQPCATVQVTLQSPQIQRGATQNIQSTVTNCGASKIKLGVTVTVTDAAGNFVLIRNTIQNYDAGQVVVFTDSYAVASGAPLGTYRVRAIVHDNSPQGNGAELARDEETFEVVL